MTDTAMRVAFFDSEDNALDTLVVNAVPRKGDDVSYGDTTARVSRVLWVIHDTRISAEVYLNKAIAT